MTTFMIAAIASISAVAFLGFTTLITHGAHGGVSDNAGLFKTGNPTLGGEPSS